MLSSQMSEYAFALSSLSSSRVRERAIRKPFNPMLGETFELVREDKGFRFVAEKVVHRPVRMACQAESQNWTFIQSPTPVQKFWGKSAELNTDGRVRIFLHTPKNPPPTVRSPTFGRQTTTGLLCSGCECVSSLEDEAESCEVFLSIRSASHARTEHVPSMPMSTQAPRQGRIGRMQRFHRPPASARWTHRLVAVNWSVIPMQMQMLEDGTRPRRPEEPTDVHLVDDE